MAAPSDQTGLRCWLDADALVGLSDTDPISTFTDSSGNGFNLTQPTVAKKPLYRTSQSPTGLAVAHFDGIDDDVGGSALSTILSSTGHMYTILAVVSVASAATGAAATYDDAAVLADASGNVGVAHLRDVAGALTMRGYNWDGSEDFVALAGNAYDTWYTIAQDHEHTGTGLLRIEKDAGGLITTASGITSIPSALFLGRNYSGAKFAAIDVGEIVIFNVILSDVRRAEWEAYLAEKWITGVVGGGGVTEYTVTITDDEFVAGGGVEGNNLVKVFVKDAAGNWST
jgi:hypothetical protein